MKILFEWHHYKVKHRYRCIEDFLEANVEKILKRHINAFAIVNFVYVYNQHRFYSINCQQTWDFEKGYVINSPNEMICDNADRDEGYNMFVKHDDYVFFINVSDDLRKHDNVIKSLLRLTKHARKKIGQWEFDYEF